MNLPVGGQFRYIVLECRNYQTSDEEFEALVNEKIIRGTIFDFFRQILDLGYSLNPLVHSGKPYVIAIKDTFNLIIFEVPFTLEDYSKRDWINFVEDLEEERN